MNSVPPPARRVLREPEMLALVGRSRSQVRRDIAAGRFPEPIVLGPNAIAWFQDEVVKWLASRPRRTYRPEPGHTDRQAREGAA